MSIYRVNQCESAGVLIEKYLKDSERSGLHSHSNNGKTVSKYMQLSIGTTKGKAFSITSFLISFQQYCLLTVFTKTYLFHLLT